MLALSVQQPWPWLIFYGKKDIENRTWAPPRSVVGQRIAIHASKKPQALEPLAVMEEIFGMDVGTWWEPQIPPLRELPLGALVGTVELLEITQTGQSGVRGGSKSAWFAGPYGWVLRNPRALEEPIPMSGRLGLWPVPIEAAKVLEAAA